MQSRKHFLYGFEAGCRWDTRLFDGAQKKVAVPLKFRGRKAVVGLHAWVLGGEKMKPVLEIKDLDKKFVGVHAVDHVSFQCYPGTVHVLQGENGAGKVQF
mgnify:CR=1 FL=1